MEQHLHNKPLRNALIVLCILAAGTLFFKFSFIELGYTNDYESYIETARFFSGEEVDKVHPHRILKPLAPLTVSFLNNFTGDFELAFFVQLSLFYLLLLIVSFLFFGEFFRGELFPTIAATAMFIFGYPMLRHGIDPFTETGALFFFLLSIFLTFRFIKSPETKLIWINALVLVLGFLFKEYSVVSYLVANAAILLSEKINRGEKYKFLFILNAIFILANLVWQGVVFAKYGYSYFDWYTEGGLSGLPFYNFISVFRVLFMLLIAGWLFVPNVLLKPLNLEKDQEKILLLLLTLPLICLLWGHVITRVFYVLAPGLIILSVLGIKNATSRKWLQYASLLAIIALNFFFLIEGEGHIF